MDKIVHNSIVLELNLKILPLALEKEFANLQIIAPVRLVSMEKNALVSIVMILNQPTMQFVPLMVIAILQTIVLVWKVIMETNVKSLIVMELIQTMELYALLMEF